MSLPTTRQELKDHCLRRLGHPVIGIEVTEEQQDDRVDEALSYYWDYHFSGAEKEYYKFVVEANNKPDAIYDCSVRAGGTGYSNSDTVVFTPSPAHLGNSAAAAITTDANGTIIDCTLSDNGTGYAIDPTVTITTGGGSGAEIVAERGGFVPLPDNIIGVTRLFPVGQSLSTNDIFNIRYQIALNDLYTLTSVSLVPFYSAFQHIELIEEILVGQQPIRFNRHRNRCYLDMDWDIVNLGSFLILEAYQIVDPDIYPDVWKDRWLIAYVTALFKRQWGEHLSKYGQMMMPGGMPFVHTYSIPVADFVG
jgi:hypothetical protein